MAQSTGGNTGLSTIVATVTDAGGNPVGDAPVAFEIIGGTGGGETISPAVAQTASVAAPGTTLGQAKTTFTSGFLPSAQGGIRIRASVVGTAVVTETTDTVANPSGVDASITIGGTAGSVTIGRSTVLLENDNQSAYILPMSVLVADSNGNALAGVQVSLSAWPIAFNTGVNCAPLTADDFFNERCR